MPRIFIRKLPVVELYAWCGETQYRDDGLFLGTVRHVPLERAVKNYAELMRSIEIREAEVLQALLDE